MLALKGLLFSAGTLILLTIISLLVVGIIAIIYRLVHKKEAPKPAAK